MKHTTHFVSTRLVSLVLSLFLVFGTAASSLSAVTDLSITDQPASAAPALDGAAGTVASAADASYGVAEGSLLAQPADDDVLDIALDDDTPAAALSAPLTLSRDKNTDLAATGALTATEYDIESSSSGYKLVNEGGWKIKNSSNKYLTVSAQGNSAQISWGNSGTTLTEGGASSDTSAQLKYDSGRVVFYISYNNGSFDASVSENNRVPIVAAVTSYIVTFNANGGSGSMDSVPNVSGSYTLPSNGFTAPDSKHFAGWKANNSGEIIAAGANYNVVGNVTFYAQWTDGTPTPTEAPSESTSSDSITYTKQIEKLNPSNADDYNYRLHLTVDGSALEGSTTETHGGGHDGKGLVVIIDTTETMTATSGVWDPENKFRAVQHLLQESGGLIDNFLNSGEGNTVTVIGIHGLAGDGTYTQLITEVASGTKLSDFSGDWNESHTSHNISYVTGFLYVDDYLKNHNDEDTTVVFITGNDPMTYVSYSGGEKDPADPRVTWQRGSTAKDWRSQYTAKTLEDYKKLMTEHPELTFYSVGVKPVERGDGLLIDMGEYSRSIGRGDYFSADSKDKLEDIFDTIQTIVIPGDKTSNITVTDTLSANVDFASNNNLTATLYTGANLATQNEVSGAVTIDGKTVTFDQSKLAQISGLSSLAEIDGPFKLEIAFDIKTIVSGQSYPDTGDDGTDYSSVSYNHNFSANKPGYYANSSATINYTLNGTAKSGTFKHPVVQAPAETPVQGKYIFKYIDRYDAWRTVEVPVTLNNREKAGYSGNNNQPGVPTFLWTSDAIKLFTNNPLVTAALRVDGNAELEDGEAQKDVSVYKHTIEWDNLNTATYTEGSNVSYSPADHTVTVTANTPVMTFTFNYKIVKDGYVLREKAATGIPYGRAVTFHPQYSDTSKYAYINDTIPSEGFSYWSADEEGNIPITTNLTFGMLIRGDFTHEEDGETIVTVYAQYGKSPSKDWTPLIEEAKLTHTVEDTNGSQIDWLYLDYMTNYLSKDGSVVKDMIDAGNSNIRYGIVAVKHDGTTTPDQAKMIKIAQAMIKNKKQSAYLDSSKQAIAYRYEYGNPTDDVKPISNFNRVLYTLRTDTEKAENHTFSAIAYITVDGTNYFYSEVNSDIVVHDLVENN